MKHLAIALSGMGCCLWGRVGGDSLTNVRVFGIGTMNCPLYSEYMPIKKEKICLHRTRVLQTKNDKKKTIYMHILAFKTLILKKVASHFWVSFANFYKALNYLFITRIVQESLYNHVFS
jgi:hypothetical protein